MGADIGALVGEDFSFQPEHEAARIDRGAQPVDLVARVVRRDQVLEAVFGPFHRALQAQRRLADEHVLRIELAAHAEAAADMPLDQVHHVGGQIQHARHLVAVVVRHLRRALHRQDAARRIEIGERTARLERHAAMAAHRHLELDHRVGGGKCGGEIAITFLDQRGFRRLERRHLCGQLVDLEAHELGGVFGSVRIFGEYQGHRLADIAHAVVRQHGLLIGLQAADAREADADRRHMAHIVEGPHGVHAGMGARLGLVDGNQLAVRHRGPHDAHMELPRRREIGGVLPAPEKQRAVLKALERGADVLHFARFFISAAAARTALRMFW